MSETGVALRDLLRLRRRELGMNQRIAAAATGVAQASICRYERGWVVPQEEVMPKLIAALDLDPEEAMLAYWNARVPGWMKVVEA